MRSVWKMQGQQQENARTTTGKVMTRTAEQARG